MPDLRSNFDEVLSDLESVAGWKTARVKRPVLILGNLDGIETGVRQLIRSEPLETVEVFAKGQKITVPTEAEILRIKGALVLKRNATRDYLDVAALAAHIGKEKTLLAFARFDELYPQSNGASALQQLYIQLARPQPYDFRETDFSTYKNLSEQWQKWDAVCGQCRQIACDLINHYPLALHIEQSQQHLLETAPTYTEQLKTLVQAKEGQAQHLEAKLETLVAKQREKVATVNAARPGAIVSLWKGAAWQKTMQREQVRLEALEQRLSRVKAIRTGMGGKRLEKLARKKLQLADPELVARHDAHERQRRERQVEEALRLAREKKERTQAQGRGRGRGLKLE